MGTGEEPGVAPGRATDEQALGSSYVLDTVIGRGSTGEVWRGRVRETDEPIAAKVLDAALTREPEVVARFIRERALLTRVDDPHVVAVRDLVVEGDTLAIVTDLVDGPSLRVLLDEHGTVRPRDAVELGRQILLGLEAVHAQGLVHRDLKPENVLVAEAGPGDARARIVDFGIAQLAHGESASQRGEIVGSAEYIAPELLEGGVASPASDLYAVGIVVYELVCGRTPFGSENVVTVIRRQLHEPAGRPAGMPMELWSVLQQLLAKSPDRRPASAAEARLLLEGVGPSVRSLGPLELADEDDPVVLDGDETIITPRSRVDAPVAAMDPTARRRGRRRWWIVAIAGVVIAGVVTAAFVATTGEPAVAATIQSAPEAWPNPKGGHPIVHRTLAIDGDAVAVTLDIEDVPQVGGYTVHEYIPSLVDARQLTVAGRGRQALAAGRILEIPIPNTGESEARAAYRIPVGAGDRTEGFLRRYEQARVAMLERLPAWIRPDTVVALDVAPEVRLRASQRAWLPVDALTLGGEETIDGADRLRSGWQWTSSNPDVAVVTRRHPPSDQAGRTARAVYFEIEGIQPGHAVVTTVVGGHRYATDVTVGRAVAPGPPCDPGVVSSGVQLSSFGGAWHPVEGSLLDTGGQLRRSQGGALVPLDRTTDQLCQDAPVVHITAPELLWLLAHPQPKG